MLVSIKGATVHSSWQPRETHANRGPSPYYFTWPDGLAERLQHSQRLDHSPSGPRAGLSYNDGRLPLTNDLTRVARDGYYTPW